MPNFLQIVAALLLATTLAALPADALAASARAAGRRAVPSAANRRREHASVLGGPIATARAALAHLEGDHRRRKYRDGWEAIGHELDLALHRAPGDPRADEARLLSAQVREGLWNISRSAPDALAAVAAYRALDELHPASESAKEGLVAAMQLAHEAELSRELGPLAKRLSTYPRSAEVREALALAPSAPARTSASKPAVAHPGTGLAAQAATAADRRARLPKDDDDASEPDGAEAAPAPARLSLRSARGGASGPASPLREPNTDVPADAARALDQLVESTRVPAPQPVEAPVKRAAPVPVPPEALPPPLFVGLPRSLILPHAIVAPALRAGAPSSAPAPATVVEENADADEESPEPELAEDEPLPHRTAASAPRAFEGAPDPRSEQHAREMRRTALADGSASVAAQLGLKIRKVVVDAGHGGRDTGAIGPHGLREKDVTLSIAKKLAARLRALGLEVLLTRSSDEYVGLDERTRIANEANADLFLSVHCNAAHRRSLSGIETWTLNVSSDHYAQRLAAFENAEAEATVSNLRLILADLATKANAIEARELAESVQGTLVKDLRTTVGKVRDNGVKQALFYVLLGAHMPAVLVETAFLSNPEEERRLRSTRYQDGTADAISRGVKAFLDERRQLALAP